MTSIRYWRALLLFAALAGTALADVPPGPASAADVAALRQQLDALQQVVNILSQAQNGAADGTVKALQEQLAALEQKVKVLEREKEIEKEAAAEKAKTAPLVTANPKDGFGFKSADGAFTLRLGGIIAYDFGFFDQDQDLILSYGDEQDGTGFRNARLNVQGTVYDNVYYKMEVEFAGQNGTDTPSFFETYVALNNIPYFGDNKGQLRLGHFREPFSIDELTPTGTGTFQERSLNSAFNPSYNPGIMWSDALVGPEKQERLYYALGIFKTADNWPSSNDSDEDQGYAFTARVAGLPYYAYNGDQVIHVGAGYTRRNPDGAILGWAARPENSLSLFRYADTEKFANFRLSNARADNVDEFNVELAASFSRWTFQSEYTLAEVDTTFDHKEKFDGYYAQLEYFLTDDHRPYRHDIATFDRVTPKDPFKWGKDGGWGAWQVALRYSAIDLSDNGVIGGEQTSWTAALNWFLNANTRFSINYVHNNVENDLLDADMDGLEVRAQVMF